MALPPTSAPQPTPVFVQPATAIGAAASLLSDLRSAPILLIIVLLNIAFVGTSGWYLLKVEEYRARNQVALIDLLKSCVLDTEPSNVPHLKPRPAQP
jgi:hypothetical protein